MFMAKHVKRSWGPHPQPFFSGTYENGLVCQKAAAAAAAAAEWKDEMISTLQIYMSKPLPNSWAAVTSHVCSAIQQ